MEHYEFITRTDKRSIINQINSLVGRGQASYQNELAIRKNHLQEILENEEKIYEDEFIEKIKSRVDKDIRERKKSLLQMIEDRIKEKEKFVVAMKLHQNMLNCLDIREELRRKDYRETQICQLEQMDDKFRAREREKKDDEFWLKVEKRIEDHIDRGQRQEDDLKKRLQANQCKILRNQLEEINQMRELDLAHKKKEKEEIDLKMKTHEGDEKRKALEARKARSEDVKKSIKTICEQQKLLAEEAEMFENVFHEETMIQVNKEIEEKIKSNLKMKQDTLSYLEYLKKFRNFVADRDRRHTEIVDEMDKRFYCYKSHHKKNLKASKLQEAKLSHETLLKQICEEQARKLKLEAAERENKILDNRFVKIKPHDRLKERFEIKNGLDKQLEELNRLKLEKQKLYEEELNRAEEDQNYCDQLLEKHKNENCDFLAPHPNWKLVTCFYNNKEKTDCKNKKH
ncbi:serine/threonine-protein kinase TAO3 [Eupeodes corollae]|uniref:serine/threonine-protein kinase TAO3 n=1 Tax=Eupeodes corollae TaxID=290404 RepID=UPI0024929A77|nr:serine/threonine-protein kinase TAO3 [Eupeodes corollae]